jgi:hypothetical protein
LSGSESGADKLLDSAFVLGIEQEFTVAVIAVDEVELSLVVFYMLQNEDLLRTVLCIAERKLLSVCKFATFDELLRDYSCRK